MFSFKVTEDEINGYEIEFYWLNNGRSTMGQVDKYFSSEYCMNRV